MGTEHDRSQQDIPRGCKNGIWYPIHALISAHLIRILQDPFGVSVQRGPSKINHLQRHIPTGKSPAYLTHAITPSPHTVREARLMEYLQKPALKRHQLSH